MDQTVEASDVATQLQRLRRLCAFLCEADSVIVRARSQPELFEGLSAAATHAGLFHLAWVGPGEVGGRSCPKAEPGCDNACADQILAPSEVAASASPTSLRLLPGLRWRDRSCGAFSIRLQDKVSGALCLHGAPAGFFGEEEVRLLDGVAVRTAYALERLEQDATLRRLWRAVEQSPLSVQITDAAAAVVYVNPAFTRVSGYTFEEVQGKNPSFLASGLTPPEVYQEMWARISSGAEWRGELRNCRKNGEVFSEEVSISPVVDGDGRITHFLAIKEDVTERRNLEAQLRQSQKMDALGRLAGGVAHDFNNLLTVILSSADFLAPSLSDGDPRGVEVGLIRESAERAAALTRQLLAFSRSQVGTTTVVDLNGTVRNLGKMIQRLIGEDVTLELVPAQEPALVLADPGQLEQVVVNLAVNARDSMPRGGTLRLLVDVHRQAAAPGAGWVQLTVADDGEGMDEATRARCLEPFFSTKSTGTGLGLATVYGIVHRAGGRVQVESAVGAGTRVHVHLPVAEPQAQARPEDPAAQRTPPRVGTVLIAEDDARVRAVCRRSLEDSGFRVLEASSGPEALEQAAAFQGPICLLLTDVVMPRMGGRELAEQFERLRPGTPVLFMSGYTDDAVLRRGLEAARVALLHKPFTPAVLLRRVEEALA